LPKVKRICSSSIRQFTTKEESLFPFFNQGSLENFPSRSAEKIFTRVWLKNKNQTLIDLDQVFNRDRDRDDNVKTQQPVENFSASQANRVHGPEKMMQEGDCRWLLPIKT